MKFLQANRIVPDGTPPSKQNSPRFMKINGDLRKVYGFKHFGGVRPKRGCDGMTSLPHNHKIENISHSQANISE